MKTAFLLSAFVISASAFAQTTTSELPEPTATSTATIETAKAPAVSAKGIRVGVWLPNLIVKTGDSPSRRIDRTFGVTAGYASLPVRRFGWIVNAGLFEMTEYTRSLSNGSEEQSVSLARLDMNAAFAVTSNFYLKAGGNISSFTQKDTQENFAPGVGFQAGLGVQLTQHIGMEAGWLNMVQYGENDSSDDDFKANGVDFGITGTF